MRIRKRKVPLPLSLLSPIPLSDPNLFSRSSVMVVQGGATPCGDDTSIVTSLNSIHSQPSDHSPDLPRLIFVGNDSHKEVEGNEVVPTSNDDARNASITTRAGATPTVDDTTTNNNNVSLLSLSNNIAGCHDGDKAIPLKKRRGSFNNFVEDNNNTTATATTTTTTPMMIKIDVKNGVNDGGENEANANNNCNVNVVSSAKKGDNKRGNTIMEGSRCSRVNGRGWRCCQPTLVGYSLCEHHLGKGRLRSMTSSGSTSSSVKARSSGKRKSNSISSGATTSPLGRDERKRVDNSDDENKLGIKSWPVKNNNRKAKLGVVKARSLSSLLGQTNNNSTSSLAGDLASMEHHETVIEPL